MILELIYISTIDHNRFQDKLLYLFLSRVVNVMPVKKSQRCIFGHFRYHQVPSVKGYIHVNYVRSFVISVFDGYDLYYEIANIANSEILPSHERYTYGKVHINDIIFYSINDQCGKIFKTHQGLLIDEKVITTFNSNTILSKNNRAEVQNFKDVENLYWFSTTDSNTLLIHIRADVYLKTNYSFIEHSIDF